MLHMTKITVLLLAIASSALAQIPLEQPTSAPVYAAAPGLQASPAVASNGNSYLAAWRDERGGVAAIYAARLDENGALLDRTGIRLTTGSPNGFGIGYGVNVVFAGSTYSVFWNEPLLDDTQESIHVARIDGDGNVVDPPRLLLKGARLSEGGVGSNGNHIVFVANRKAYVLDASAQIITDSIVLPIPQPNVTNANVASNGSGFLAVWAGQAFGGLEIDAVELDANGRPIAPAQIVAAHASGVPMAIGSNGSDYLLVYAANGVYQTVRITHGAQASAEPQALTTPDGIPNESLLLWTGSNYVLLWTQAVIDKERQFLLAQRIDAKGQPIDTQAFPIAQEAPFGLAAFFGAATNGRTLQFAWMSEPAATPSSPYPEFDMHAMNVNANDLRLAAETNISVSARQQFAPDIAFSGRNYLAVWREDDGVYASRITTDGHALDGRGIRLSTAASSPLRVVFDGAHYVVGFEVYASGVTSLLLTRIDPDSGAVLDDNGVPIATGTCDFGLATNGATTLVVFDDCKTQQLQALRVNELARPVGVPVAISPSNVTALAPSIAWSGSEWLVAFTEAKGVPLPVLISPQPIRWVPVKVDAVRLTPELTLLDTAPIAIATGDIDNPQSSPHAASSGSDFLVTWTRDAKGVVLGRRIALDGSAGETEQLIGSGSGTSTIWTGSTYAAAFTASNGQIMGATIGAAIRYFRIGAGTLAHLVAADERITATYQRLATEPLYGGISRTFVKDAAPLRSRPGGR